jgi:hypothetical protein
MHLLLQQPPVSCGCCMCPVSCAGFHLLYDSDVSGLPPSTVLDVLRHQVGGVGWNIAPFHRLPLIIVGLCLWPAASLLSGGFVVVVVRWVGWTEVPFQTISSIL